MHLDQNELLDQLRIKVKFIGKSSIDFDNGDYESAIEISTNIRAILHDTSDSTSLLTQLNKNHIRFLNTSDGIFKSKNNLPQFTLVKSIINSELGIHYYPFLLNSLVREWLLFDEWWHQVIVYLPKQNIVIRRRDLILKLANKYDAHIGTDIPRYYHDLFKANDTIIGFTWIKNKVRLNHLQTPLFPSVRQIAHELIESLNEEFKDEIDFTSLYFNKLISNPTSISGFSNVSIGTQTKSQSLLEFEKLGEEKKLIPVKISKNFIERLRKINPHLNISVKETEMLFETLKPYSLSEEDIINYFSNFMPFFESFLNDIRNKLNEKHIISGIGLLRTSIWMNNDDFFIDEDPPHGYKVLREKFNKLMKAAHKNH